MQWTRNFWSGACGSVFQTMILFQTKVCNLKYRPIFLLSDQAVSNRYPILDTTASNPYLWRLTYLCSLYREINTPPPGPRPYPPHTPKWGLQCLNQHFNVGPAEVPSSLKHCLTFVFRKLGNNVMLIKIRSLNFKVLMNQYFARLSFLLDLETKKREKNMATNDISLFRALTLL